MIVNQSKLNQNEAMVEDKEDHESFIDDKTIEEWLSNAQELVPMTLNKARQVKGFIGRWKMIISKLEQFPSRLLDLSTHPCFSKNTLCKEQLQSVCKTLNEAIELANKCIQEKYEGKLRMQSDLDSLLGKLDLNLRDCGLLITSGVLGEISMPSTSSSSSSSSSSYEYDRMTDINIRELLARLQIRYLEAKHKALDTLLEIMKEYKNSILSVLGRSNIDALIQLLSSASPIIREKIVTFICSIAESGSRDYWVVSEEVLPSLIRLIESGNSIGKEKAMISLQRLSVSPEIARAIVGHGGVRSLIELCQEGDSVSQKAAICTLKNMSCVPKVRQALAEEGIIKVMIHHLDCGPLVGPKEYAAECLQNLTASEEALRRLVISEGGVQSLLNDLKGPSPQESSMGALSNLVGSVSIELLKSLGFFPRLVHVLKYGSVGAQQAAASSICKICKSNEVKKIVSEAGCIPFLINMLEAKSKYAQEIASQALSILMTLPENSLVVKKDGRSVPNLVQLLDSNPKNTAKKYAVLCLLYLTSSRKCKKVMVSYGAIGYLKKLTEMDIPGAKKLLVCLERGKFRNLFSRK